MVSKHQDSGVERTMIGRTLFVAIAGCALIQGSASAQMPGFPGRIAVEVRGGMSVGNHSESAAKLDVVPKPSFDAVLKVEVIPTLSVFGGFYRTTFGCEEGFCTERDHYDRGEPRSLRCAVGTGPRSGPATVASRRTPRRYDQGGHTGRGPGHRLRLRCCRRSPLGFRPGVGPPGSVLPLYAGEQAREYRLRGCAVGPSRNRHRAVGGLRHGHREAGCDGTQEEGGRNVGTV